MSLNKWLLLIFITSVSLWVYIVFNDEIEDRVEEHKPRDWKHYCTVENPKSKLCWGGDKAPWIGGPFCKNLPRLGNEGANIVCKLPRKK